MDSGEPTAQSMRNWVAQVDLDEGRRPIKSRGLVRDGDRLGAVTAFQFVSANQATCGIATMCRMLEVFTSGYYAWWQWPPSARALGERTQSLIARDLQRTTDPRRPPGWGHPQWGTRRWVARLIREAGLVGVNRK
jgi:hypothetical protein